MEFDLIVRYLLKSARACIQDEACGESKVISVADEDAGFGLVPADGLRARGGAESLEFAQGLWDRSPPALRLWEFLAEAMLSPVAQRVQLDWPSYDRSHDWQADVVVLHELAGAWRELGCGRGFRAFLVHSIMPFVGVPGTARPVRRCAAGCGRTRASSHWRSCLSRTWRPRGTAGRSS